MKITSTIWIKQGFPLYKSIKSLLQKKGNKQWRKLPVEKEVRMFLSVTCATNVSNANVPKCLSPPGAVNDSLRQIMNWSWSSQNTLLSLWSVTNLVNICCQKMGTVIIRLHEQWSYASINDLRCFHYLFYALINSSPSIQLNLSPLRWHTTGIATAGYLAVVWSGQLC